jgi:hypothetical protein
MDDLNFTNEMLAQDLAALFHDMANDEVLVQALVDAFDRRELIHLTDAMKWACDRIGYE